MKTIEPAEAEKLVKDGFLATHVQRLEMQKSVLRSLLNMRVKIRRILKNCTRNSRTTSCLPISR